MRRHWLIAFGLMGLMLALYVAAVRLGLTIEDPEAMLSSFGPAAGGVSVGLLMADVFAPIPTSLIMAADGALYGVVLGTWLSVLGAVGSFALGFVIGRRSEWLIERIVGPEERRRADRLLSRYGYAAIVVSRPLPMLAETVALLAGASSLPEDRSLLAALAGIVPQAAFFALAGASVMSLPAAVTAFSAVLAAMLLGALWLQVHSRGPSESVTGSGA